METTQQISRFSQNQNQDKKTEIPTQAIETEQDSLQVIAQLQNPGVARLEMLSRLEEINSLLKNLSSIPLALQDVNQSLREIIKEQKESQNILIDLGKQLLDRLDQKSRKDLFAEDPLENPRVKEAILNKEMINDEN